MPFSLKAYYAAHPLTVTTETAKEAFAKAVEWRVVKRFTDVSISDGIKGYTIAEFASAMAIQEIAKHGRGGRRAGAEGEGDSASSAEPPSQPPRAQRAHEAGIRPRAAAF